MRQSTTCIARSGSNPALIPLRLANPVFEPSCGQSPAGGRANSLADAAMRLEPNRLRRGDPAAFPEKIVESFWQRLVEATPGLGDAWDASKKDEL